jgi:hypothetical protein
MEVEDSGGLVQTTRKMFVEKAFGLEFIQALKEHGLTTRDLYELSSPTTQCDNVVGKCDPMDCTCWLCGLPIYLDEDGNRTQDKKDIGDRFTPECEHVLPVMQAVLVLGGLYSERVRRADDGWWNHIRKFFPLEYRWSHSICNNTKDENLFFDDNGAIQDYLIDDYLNKIYSKLKIPFEKRAWLMKQKNDIKIVLQPIVDYYSKRIAEEGNLFLLSSTAVGVEAVVNLPNILEEGNKVRTFIELWQPEIIPPPTTMYASEASGPVPMIEHKNYIEYLNLIPFNRIYDYMKELSTKRDERKYLIANNYLDFYKKLFNNTSDKVSQITELDIKSGILAYYFLNKDELNSLIDEIIRLSGNNSNVAQPYIIALFYYIIYRKLLIKSKELGNSDPDFISLVKIELETADSVIRYSNYSEWTSRILPVIFPPTGGYKKKQKRKKTRKQLRRLRKARTTKRTH